jgi:glutamine---fructose-6-phosphate transaminase (isomerizing)
MFRNYAKLIRQVSSPHQLLSSSSSSIARRYLPAMAAAASRSDSSSSSSSGQNLLTKLIGVVPLAVLFLLDQMSSQKNKAKSCGIVGVVGSENASEYLLEGLTILRNRGYDSAGIATIPEDGSSLDITKYASRKSTADSIDLLR